jgi:hypothetical protein
MWRTRRQALRGSRVAQKIIGVPTGEGGNPNTSLELRGLYRGHLENRIPWNALGPLALPADQLTAAGARRGSASFARVVLRTGLKAAGSQD